MGIRAIFHDANGHPVPHVGDPGRLFDSGNDYARRELVPRGLAQEQSGVSCTSQVSRLKS